MPDRSFALSGPRRNTQHILWWDCPSGLRSDPYATLALRINCVAGSDSDRTIKPPISEAQLRAARALLKWLVRDLSAQCRVSLSAIVRGEKVDGAPPMQVRNLEAIRRAFEEHGIEFLGLDGVRLLPGHRQSEPRRGE